MIYRSSNRLLYVARSYGIKVYMLQRISWSKKLIQKKLIAYVQRLGRMPSASELRANGDNALACAIPRWGGYRKWAELMNTGLKSSATKWALLIEDKAEDELRKRGYTVVRQTVKAPFDLLVNGHMVDVKTAHPSYYGGSPSYRGWIFRTVKREPTCDFYFCFCFDESDCLVKTYIIPSRDAKVTTITIATNGRFEQYRDNFELLL